jgi:hypothetical protein
MKTAGAPQQALDFLLFSFLNNLHSQSALRARTPELIPISESHGFLMLQSLPGQSRNFRPKVRPCNH